MSLLPDSATFHEQVEACFVAYRGRGVSLSAVDVELVDDWAKREVPFEVIARGLRKAAEAALVDAPAGEGALRSLKSARRAVESEITKYLKVSAGRTSSEAPAEVEPFHLLRHRRLVKALQTLAREQPSLEPVTQAIAALPPPADFQQANRHEELALALVLRRTPERTSILREARRLVENASPASAAARLESLRFHRAALVRQRWSMAAFW